MPSHKGYWVIEVTEGFTTIFRKRVPGHLSNHEIIAMLQRIAARALSPREVIAASLRKPHRTSVLEARVDGPPHGKRVMIWLPSLSDYKASYWREDELAEYPEIFDDD